MSADRLCARGVQRTGNHGEHRQVRKGRVGRHRLRPDRGRGGAGLHLHREGSRSRRGRLVAHDRWRHRLAGWRDSPVAQVELARVPREILPEPRLVAVQLVPDVEGEVEGAAAVEEWWFQPHPLRGRGSGGVRGELLLPARPQRQSRLLRRPVWMAFWWSLRTPPLRRRALSNSPVASTRDAIPAAAAQCWGSSATVPNRS